MNTIENILMGVNGVAIVINLFLLICNYRLNKKQQEYTKYKEMFDDNIKQYRDFLKFLLTITFKYKNNYVQAQGLVTGGEDIWEPPINKLLEITQVIYYENVEVAEFTGLSSKNLKELKDIILENKENFFMLKYLKLLEEADLEIYESHGKIELPDGKYYNLDQFNAPENVYDIDKLILDVAVKDIEKIQNLVNRYNEIQFDLLN